MMQHPPGFWEEIFQGNHLASFVECQVFGTILILKHHHNRASVKHSAV